MFLFQLFSLPSPLMRIHVSFRAEDRPVEKQIILVGVLGWVPMRMLSDLVICALLCAEDR